jgi:hypothetical protein
MDDGERDLPEVVSLMCDPGRLIVRVVWMVGKMPNSGDVGAVLALQGGLLASNPSSVRRCQLQLPQFTNRPDSQDGKYPYVNMSQTATPTTVAEVEAALRSSEVNCRPVGTGQNSERGGFPPNSWYTAGTRWFSDTITFDFAGCEGVYKPGADYQPTVPYLVSSKQGFKYLVAKFEVQEVK